VQTRVGSRAFSVAAPTLWNTLPVVVRNSESRGIFESSVTNYLLSLS
jgi:hypothetical protein